MRNFLKQVPLPMAGLTLGLASLGNLYKLAGWQLVGDLTGIVAALLFWLVLLKLCLTPLHAAGSLQDPIIASVSPTFSMTLMILCTYFVAWGMPLPVATIVWLMAVAIHFGLMIFFVLRHLISQPKAWHMIYPSWFVTFVGLGVIPVTSSQFVPALGQPLFWMALVIYVALFPFVLHRLRHVPLPEATQPLLTIMAAPASLCLTGYLASFDHPNFWLATGMLIFAQSLYFITLVSIRQYTRLSFYPSFAAFTFPLVISATALTKYIAAFAQNGAVHDLMSVLQWGEWIAATLMLVFVTGHYLHFLRRIRKGVKAAAQDAQKVIE